MLNQIKLEESFFKESIPLTNIYNNIFSYTKKDYITKIYSLIVMYTAYFSTISVNDSLFKRVNHLSNILGFKHKYIYINSTRVATWCFHTGIYDNWFIIYYDIRGISIEVSHGLFSNHYEVIKILMELIKLIIANPKFTVKSKILSNNLNKIVDIKTKKIKSIEEFINETS